MTLAISLFLASLPKQASELLDAALAHPASVIAAQISTKGRFLADGYEFADEFRLDTLVRRRSPMGPLEVLISRGSESIPYLLTQLASKEPTAFKIGETPDVVSVAYEYYEPKVRAANMEVWTGVSNDTIMKAPQYKHTISRGDLAFFALGQITNRPYGVLGGNPLLNLYCSASDHPSVQKSAIADWGNAKSEDLKVLLRNDVLHPDSYSLLTFGFCRFRTYYPSEAAELAVDCLRTAYGKWPKGEPNPSPRSFIIELQTVPSRDLDQDCQRILMKTDKENRYLDEYDLTKYEVLLYLRNRQDYMPICLNFATDMVKKKTDKYGYFKRFLENYGKKKQ